MSDMLLTLLEECAVPPALERLLRHTGGQFRV
jgi:hypothetical protein